MDRLRKTAKEMQPNLHASKDHHGDVMIDALCNITFLAALITMPGIIADLVVRLLQAMRISLFPLMAPERVPHAMAIYVTQWWMTLIGLALIGAVTHSWFHNRSHNHTNES